MFQIMQKADFGELMKKGLLVVGEGTKIDGDVWLCHDTKNGTDQPLRIGRNCVIRSGTVIYRDVEIGDNVNFGHHVVVREGCRIGSYSSIGTGVKVECYTKIGNHVSIETQSHITGWMTIEDYVFIGGFAGSTNDMQMKWQRRGHGQDLKGATVKYGARIGSGAILMPAITIGRHAIINAGEIVRRDVPDNVLFFTRKGREIFKTIKEEKIATCAGSAE